MPAGSGIMIVAEVAEGALSPSAAELVSAGRALADQLGEKLVGVILGSGLVTASAELASLPVDGVIAVDDPALAEPVSDTIVAALAALARDRRPSTLLALHSSVMREAAARLAFRLGTGIVTDCTALRIDGDDVVMRKPVFGGSAIAEYVVETARPRMATLRMRAFTPAEPSAASAAIETISAPASDPVTVKLVETARAAVSSGPRLKDAKLVVSGGRGVGGPENWHYIDELAGALGAATGATRAVTDAGWVAPSMQVGLTGVTITPDLYVTVAVSGAVQHIAGCSGSRNIVAINKDPDANIFRHARFGIVGDYKQVLPALTAKIKELRA